jgi:hypothetical protein
MHWVGSESLPCDGPGCRHCPKRKFSRGYVEALVRQPGEQRTRRVILELHRQANDIIDGRPARGLVLDLTRAKGKYDSPIAREERGPDEVPEAIWDVRACMERIWGTRFGIFTPDQSDYREAQ